MSHTETQKSRLGHGRDDPERDGRGHDDHGHDGHGHGNHGDHDHDKEKYFVDIEGAIHPWNRNSITFEEIVHLGGWDASQGVVEIDKDNNERTLHPGEVVELKPGHGFSKKVRWKRG